MFSRIKSRKKGKKEEIPSLQTIAPIRVEIHPKGAKGKHKKHARDERELEWGNIRARINKESSDSPLGFKVVRYNHRDGIFLAHIDDGSQLYDTDLKPGMRITKINNIACPDTIAEMVAMFKDMNGALEIQAIGIGLDDDKDDTTAAPEPTIFSVLESTVATFFDSLFLESGPQ